MAVDFSFLDNLLTDEDTTDYSYLFDDVTDLTPEFKSTGLGSFDVSSLFGDDTDYGYLFDDVTDLTPSFPTVDLTSTTQKLGILDTILGLFGQGSSVGQRKAQGIMQGVGGGITDFANSPIGQLLLYNYLKDQDKKERKIPIGAEAYGDQGLGSMPDYRVFNIQPALMPGVAYANAPPPEMKHGGIHGAGKDDGPGDITLARLEPGEFVMTRKATENIGARNLYNLMKQAERMG